MLPLKKFQEILPQDIVQLLKEHYAAVMPAFYEMQSAFLSEVYKRYKGINGPKSSNSGAGGGAWFTVKICTFELKVHFHQKALFAKRLP